MLRAALLVLLARGALRVVPFRVIVRSLRGGTETATLTDANAARVAKSNEAIRRKIWAIDAAGRHLLPRKPCLTQALIVHRLLRRHGRPSELRLGARRAADGKLEAHAWIESGGEIVIGGKALAEGYTPLPSLFAPSDRPGR